MNTYGYVRVSTADQNENRQLLEMKSLSLSKLKLYIDKQSGKNFNRPSYIKMIKKLKPGDVLYVKSIDRLGRNYHEIQEQWRFLTKEIGIILLLLICRCWTPDAKAIT